MFSFTKEIFYKRHFVYKLKTSLETSDSYILTDRLVKREQN